MLPCRLLYTMVLSLMVYPTAVAHQVAGAPPVGYLFAAFLGYNPLATMIPAKCAECLAGGTGRQYHFPGFLPITD